MSYTATQPTYYTVIWGDGDHDRVTYADYHDGTETSATADVRAASHMLRLATAKVRCGLWVNGDLEAGENLTDGPDRRPEFPADPPVEHKTRTVLDAHQNERYVTKSNGSCGRYVRSDTATARCTCGWTYQAGSRDEARSAARTHRTDVVLGC